MQALLSLTLWSPLLLAAHAASNCSHEDLSRIQPQSFVWENRVPKFINSEEKLCGLLTNKTHNRAGLRYNVLSFGDSYEIRFCDARPSGKIRKSFAFKEYGPLVLYADCSHQNESIQYKIRRVFGQRGDPKGTWARSNETSLTIFAELGKYFNRSPSLLISPRADADADTVRTTVDAVLHGSFLWDLLHTHNDWCRAHRTEKSVDPLLNSTCLHVSRRRLSSLETMRITEMTLQSWGRITVPWCNAAMLRQWKNTYLREVHALLEAFPTAALFLRTQPISSAVFLGNFRCHKPMNDYIAHVARSFQITSDLSKSRVVRLIDVYSLFAAPNDRGVDHFSPDNIHLTKEGEKIYRAFILRVISDYFHLTSLS
jgi:hypothetical protein